MSENSSDNLEGSLIRSLEMDKEMKEEEINELAQRLNDKGHDTKSSGKVLLDKFRSERTQPYNKTQSANRSTVKGIVLCSKVQQKQILF